VWPQFLNLWPQFLNLGPKALTVTEGFETATLIEQIAELSFSDITTHIQQQTALLDEVALSRLLDETSDLARSNPEKARAITAVCIERAHALQAHALIPRATYIQAQAHAAKGDLEESLQLIQQAHDDYQALNQALPALRTHVGRIHILNEMGRHQEALSSAQTVMDRLAQSGELDHNREAQLIAGLTCQNKGVCYRLMGRYEAALAAYAAAESWFQTIGLRERVGDIQNNRGIILLHLGRASEALTEFESASTILAAAGRTLLQSQSLINSGDAHLLLGSYKRSLTALAEARHLLSSLEGFGLARSLLLQEAHVYLALNLYPEALSAYREAEAACREAGYHHYQARALWGKSVALAALGQLEEAESAQSQAIKLFTTAGNIPLLCIVMLEQADLQAKRGQREAALALAEEALALVALKPDKTNRSLGRWPVQRLYAHLRLADLHLPDLAQTEAHLLQAQKLAEVLVLPHVRYRLYQRLGWLRWQQGHIDEAEQWLQTAVSEIEQLRGTVAQEAMRISFWRDKAAAYENLLQLYLERDGVEAVQDAFLVAEQAKSRTLLDLLNGVITVGDQQSTATPQLTQLQGDLNAIYNAFLDTSEIETPPSLTDLRQRAQVLEQEISQLRLQMERGSVTLDPFTAALHPDKLLARLPDDLLLIAYHTIGDEVLAFVKAAGNLNVVRNLTTVSAVQRQLNQLNIQWRHFRAGPDFVQRHMHRLTCSTWRILQTLYQKLVAPLAHFLPPDSADVHPLAIVPHGLLHQVPFHALRNEQTYLIDRFEISYAPSTNVLALCQERPYAPPRQGAIFGLPDPLIPAVEKEVMAVTQQFPGVDTHLAEKATITAVQQQLAQNPPDFLHFACHGLFRADNPIFSALKLHDGWLTAADILTFDLSDTLVTLSACESGRAQVDAGDEVLGLARAFLGAGASGLVVSLWVVEDEATVDLMTGWYTCLAERGLRPAAALRAAQLAQKERYAHPYYWAPFLLMGKR
jgi:CHAT domain-containing protein/tetratricopeptide (TPR) repeat protein